MLAILGLFGAVCAGFLADSVLSSKSVQDQDDEAEGFGPEEDAPASPSDGSEAEGNMLDWVHGEPEAQPQMPLAQFDTDAEQDLATEPDPLGETNSRDDGPDSSDLPQEPEPGIVLEAGEGDSILTGQSGDDTVTGGSGGDLLGGRDGDDSISGEAGRDVIHGGAGADSLDGGDGADTIHAEDGDDVIQGGDGDDMLAGHEDADRIEGGAGSDTVMGGAGSDTLDGNAGDDWLAGGFGNDLLRGGAGSDMLDGNDGADTLFGFDPAAPDADADFLNGGNGDDVLWLGANDHGHGGAGADEFRIGDWIGEGQFARIADFDPSEDEIVVVYDAQSHPDPHLTLVSDEGSPDVTVFLDGLPLAEIAGGAGLELSQLRLLASADL